MLTATPARIAARRTPYRFAAVALSAVALDVAVDPIRTHLPLCPMHALTGWLCPLCGSLRAVDELARGHPVAALHDNALLLVALPGLLGLWVAWVVRAGSGGVAAGRRRGASVALLVLVLAFTVVRNLPFASALRP